MNNSTPFNSALKRLHLEYASTKKRIVSCPLCDRNQNEVVCRRDRHQLGINTVLCRHCGMLFHSPRPPDKWYDIFYREYYWDLYAQSQDIQIERQQSYQRCNAIVNLVLPKITEPIKSVLDIGCGTGGMLQVMREKIPEARLTGTDPSAHSIEMCSSEGFKVVQTNWEVHNNPLIPPDNDLITVIHVAEHLLDPVTILANAVTRAARDKWIYIDVPNMLSDKWSGETFLHIAHPMGFCEHTLQLLLRRLGYATCETVVGAAKEQWPWSIGILGKMTQTAPMPAVQVPAAPAFLLNEIKEKLASVEARAGTSNSDLQSLIRKAPSLLRKWAYGKQD